MTLKITLFIHLFSHFKEYLKAKKSEKKKKHIGKTEMDDGHSGPDANIVCHSYDLNH